MIKKVIHIFTSFLILLPLLTGVFVSTPLSGDIPIPSFKNICHIDSCNSHLPQCPLCPSSSFVNPFFHQVAGSHLPIPSSSFSLIDPSHLSNQEFVKFIFHPPKSIL